MSDANEDIFHIMVEGRMSDIKKAIDEIENEIKERKGIDENVQKEIQNEILAVRNQILEVEQFSGGIYGNKPAPRVDVLVKEISDLESQKRAERISFWRDTTFLRKEIRAYSRELSDLLRKAKLVQSDDSGRRFAEKA